VTNQPAKLPEWRPGNPEIFWFIRDHCRWPMTAKVVYEALYKRWGGKELYPSDSLLAKDIGSSPATVKRWRKWLREHNLLQWTTDNTGKVNTYHLLPPWNYLGQNNLGQIDLGQNDLGHLRDRVQNDLGQNDLGHCDLGDLGQNDLRRRKEEEEKDIGTTTAISRESTDGFGDTQTSKVLLGGGCGGRSREGDEKQWESVVPPLPEWNGVREYSGALNDVLEILGEVGLADDYPLVEQNEASRPYALVLQKFKDAAAAKGRPLQWWIQHAGIAASRLERHFDAAFLEAGLSKLARGEVLNPGVPEWASLGDFLFSENPQELWGYDFDAAEAAKLGSRLPRDAGAVFDFMRWTAVNKTAVVMAGKPGAAPFTDKVRDLLLQAEETGARLEDDPAAMQFRLVGGLSSVRAELICHSELVQQILQVAYRLPERPIYHDYVIWLHARLWRTDLVEALERGNWALVERLVQERPEHAALLSQDRGWAARYPAVAPLFSTLERMYAS